MQGVSAHSIHDESSGVVSFLSHRPLQFVNTCASKITCHHGPSQQSPVLAKSQWWPYMIVVFEGSPIMPLGLLQELHSHHMLAHIPISLPEETKDGHKPWILCCPFCTYIIQNNLAFLNHIINAHYHTNFACGRCLGTVTTLGQQMKRYNSECPRLPALPEKSSQESVHSEHSLKKCAHGSSGSKSKDGGNKSQQKCKSEKSQPS